MNANLPNSHVTRALKLLKSVQLQRHSLTQKDCFVLISYLCRQIWSDCEDYTNVIKCMTYDPQYRNTQAYSLFHVLISWVQRDDKPPE